MAVKPTKVPSMHQNLAYSDWKKEVKIWQMTNTPLGVNKAVLAGTLFESLTGQARSTVLSSVELDNIVSDVGVDNILNALDNFFGVDEVQGGFQAQDDLNNFRRKPNTSYKEFMIEFQLRANKVKLSGTTVSDGVLGYTLLKCANLPPGKEELIRTTCDKVDIKSVQKQLSKLNFSDPSLCNSTVKYTSVKSEDQPSTSGKIETFYQNQASSSDNETEELYDAYYGQNNQRLNNSRNSQSAGAFKLNPLDKYGHVTACGYCKCIYHYVPDCQYASDAVKADARKRSKFNRYQPYHNLCKKNIVTSSIG